MDEDMCADTSVRRILTDSFSLAFSRD